MKRSSLKLLIQLVALALAIFLASQILLSFLDLLQARSNLIQLTFVEPGNNLEVQQHPYYTICPIFETSANLSDPDMDLFSAMTQNAKYFPVSLFFSLINSQSLTAVQSTTWAKMKTSKKHREILVPCTTFNIPNNVTLGQNEARVDKSNLTLHLFQSRLGLSIYFVCQINFILFGKEPTYVQDTEPVVEEFRIYIHESLGYINTFLLNGGEPHLIVPGYDKKLEVVRPQLLVVNIK